MSSPPVPPGVGSRVRRNSALQASTSGAVQSDFNQAVTEASKLNQKQQSMRSEGSNTRAGPGPPALAPREPSKPRSLTPGRSAQASSVPPQRPQSLREHTAGSKIEAAATASDQHPFRGGPAPQPPGLSSRMQDAIAAASAPPPPEPPSPDGNPHARPNAHQDTMRSRLDVQASSHPGGGAPAAVPRQQDTVYSREQKLQDTLAKANATLAEFRARVGAPAPSQPQQQPGSPQWHPYPQQQYAQQHSNAGSPWQQQPQRGYAYGSPASQPSQNLNHSINWGGGSPGTGYGVPPQPSPQHSPHRSPATRMPGARILFSSSGSAHSPSPFGGGAFPPAPPGQGVHTSSTPPHWAPPQHASPPKHSSNTQASSRSSSPDSSAAAASAVLDGQLDSLRQQLKEEQAARKQEQDAHKQLQAQVDGMDSRAADTLQALVAQLASAGVQVRLPSDKQPPNAVGIKAAGDDGLATAVLSVPQLPPSTSEAVVAALAAERARFSAREAAIRDEMSASSRWYQDMARRAEEDVVAARDKATMDALDAEATASESRKAFEQRVRQRSMQVVSELRAEIQSLETELEAAHARHTSLEEQVRSQFEAHCRSFENRLRGRASAAISAIRHASEVAAQHHYTRQLRAARDAIKNNLLQQSVAGVVDVTAVDKLFADLALMPMLSAAPSQLSDWTAGVHASTSAARRPSDATSVGGAEAALQAVMLDSQAAASEALAFFSDTLQGAGPESAGAAAATPGKAATPAPAPAAAVGGSAAPSGVEDADKTSSRHTAQSPVTPPKPSPATAPQAVQQGLNGPAPAKQHSLAQAGPPPAPAAVAPAPAAVAPAPAPSPTTQLHTAAPRPPPPRPPGVAVPSTAARASGPATAPKSAAPPRPPPGVAGKSAGRSSTTSVHSSGSSVVSRQSSSSAERPSSPPPAATALPKRRALTARSKPGAIQTRARSPAAQRKEEVLQMLRADASSFRRAPTSGTRKVIRDQPLNPTRARRLRQQNSPSPTGKALGDKIRSKVFK